MRERVETGVKLKPAVFAAGVKKALAGGTRVLGSRCAKATGRRPRGDRTSCIPAFLCQVQIPNRSLLDNRYRASYGGLGARPGETIMAGPAGRLGSGQDARA